MKELSVLKSVLKKKVKITQALFVLFLITGTVSYGKQINNGVVNTEVVIKDFEFENKGTIFKDRGEEVMVYVSSLMKEISNSGIIRASESGTYSEDMLGIGYAAGEYIYKTIQQIYKNYF